MKKGNKYNILVDGKVYTGEYIEPELIFDSRFLNIKLKESENVFVFEIEKEYKHADTSAIFKRKETVKVNKDDILDE